MRHMFSLFCTVLVVGFVYVGEVHAETKSDVQIDHKWLFEGNGTLQHRANILQMGIMPAGTFLNDGVAWGPQYVSDEARWTAIINDMVRYQIHGKPFLMMENTGNFAEPHPELEEAVALVDVYGNPIAWTEKYGWESNNVYKHNVLHPLMRDLFKAHLKSMIDAGATGVTFDLYTVEAIIADGGTFDAWTEEEFRRYLLSKYTPSELETRFGIEDPYGFDLSDWIVAKGLARTWNHPPYRPLIWEYVLFLLHTEQKVFGELVQFAKEYAQNAYGRRFWIGANAHPAYGWAGRLAPFCDYFVREDFAFNSAPQALAEAFRAMDTQKPRVFLLEVYDNPADGRLPSSPLNDLLYWQMGKILSSRSSVLLPPKIFRAVPGWRYTEPLAYDYGAVNDIAAFVGNNRSLYEQERVPAKLGVLFDDCSNLNSVIAPGSRSWWWWTRALLAGTARILFEEHIPFDFVYVPDPRFSNKRLSISDLFPYKVVLVPNALSLPAYMQTLLLEYVQRGGVIIATGDTAKYDENMSVANSELRRLLMRGRQRLGRGEVRYFPKDPGLLYVQGRKAARSTLIRVLSQYLTPQIVLNSPDVRSILYKGGDALIVHLVNDRYIKDRDKLEPTGTLRLKVARKEAGDPIVFLLSPENTKALKLPYTQREGYIELTVPSFRTFCVIVIKPKRSLDISRVSVSPDAAGVSASGGVAKFLVDTGTEDIRVVNWYLDDIPVLEQARNGIFELHLQLGATKRDLRVKCEENGTGQILGEWQLHPPDVSVSVHMLYDFEPVSGEIAERAVTYLYGKALELFEASQGGLQGIACFPDRGTAVKVSWESANTWKGEGTLRITYTPRVADDWQQLFTGVMLTNVTQTGLEGSTALRFAYAIDNEDISMFIVIFDAEGEAWSVEVPELVGDKRWHEIELELAGFKFGGYGSPDTGNKVLDLEGIRSIHIYLVGLNQVGRTTTLLLDDLAFVER